MYFSYIGRAKGQWKYMVYAIIAYTIVFGIRYGVGKDYINYLQNFEAYATSETHWGMSQSFELGFHFLTQTIAAINLHPTIYFSVIAFMQLFLTLLPFKKETELYPYIIFTFMVGCTWLSYANIVRQTIALSIGIFAIKFIVEKKVWHFYITAFIALTMHLSAVLLFLFYPLFNYRKEWFRNIKFQLLLLVENCGVNIRVNKEETTNLLLAHTHHHEELSVIYPVKLRQQDITPPNTIGNRPNRYLHYTTASSARICSSIYLMYSSESPISVSRSLTLITPFCAVFDHA